MCRTVFLRCSAVAGTATLHYEVLRILVRQDAAPPNRPPVTDSQFSIVNCVTCLFCYTIIMKPITTSQFCFERVINNGNVYVDKTDLLYKLVKIDGGQFFISRPRRFGKSLMLSTLKCIFEGRKELFEGLKIAKTDYDWKVYPVLHMDMAKVSAGSIEAMAYNLVGMVKHLASQLKIDIKENNDPGAIFENLWKAIADKNLQVVVLVDEYDMPLQGYLNDPENFERVRKMMHDFYVRIKSYSGNIRFMMMTGVSKFAKLSIFSGLNNLIDLTMSADYAGLLGYTHDELKEFFAEHIAAFAEKKDVTPDAIFAQLLEWYDNYRFSPDSDIKVLNPVSVGLSLSECSFYAYWNATGAPTLVMEALQKTDQWPSDLDHVEVMKTDLDMCDALTMPATPLLYQSGYLTIKDADGDFLTLGIPNKEVRGAIVRGHIASLINQNNASKFNAQSFKAMRALQAGKLDDAIAIFRTTVAGLPYEWLIKDEGSVKIAFLDFFHAMDGAHVTAERIDTERETANGRIDAIIETKDNIYIFEFKYGKSAQEAFDQIIEKGYHLPYLNKPVQSNSQFSIVNSQFKKVYGIGLNFTPENGTRGIDEAVVALLQS